MNTLSISNLTKVYANGVKAIDDFSITLSNGMFGLLGPNGAGKSSLMRMIAGLALPNGGHIEFNGVDIVKDPRFIKKQLGYLPQDFGVYPRVSAIRLMEHLAILKGLTNKKERTEQILFLLQKTNLYEVRNKDVHTYSGGMKQRFGIAQALLANPQIVVVDEPTAGLDPEERNRFNNLLSEIGEQVIVILSTHIVEDVKDLCPNMGVVSNGKLLVHGSPDHFIQTLSGKIWKRAIQKSEIDNYRKEFNLISSKLNGGRLTIHVYSVDSPGEGFIQASPELEDVYFSTLSNNN